MPLTTTASQRGAGRSHPMDASHAI